MKQEEIKPVEAPQIDTDRLNQLLKIVFADAIRISVQEEEYTTAHHLQQYQIKNGLV